MTLNSFILAIMFRLIAARANRPSVLHLGAAAMVVVLAGSALHAQDNEVERLKRSATATCAIAGLIATPPAGWINVPFEAPPAGQLGCLMLRYNEQAQLLGVLRIRSASEPAAEFTDEAYDRLLANEITAIVAMDIVVDLEGGPLWRRDKVPVSGAGFRDGRAVGLRARIKDNDVAQEAHLMVFRSDSSKYLVSLVTPAQTHDKALYQANTGAMGALVRTLKPSGSR
jgi:hypothetical protein